MKKLSFLSFVALLLPGSLSADELTPVITEFMASNNDTIVFEDGTSPDWMEIHNPGDTPIDLAGWHLTDDPAQLTRWTFPAGVTLEPGAFLMVFASGDDLRDPANLLHTNFELEQSGEYLALVTPTGEIHQDFAPEYPSQLEDVSYGLAFNGALAYFTTATPAIPNGAPSYGIVKDTKFSVDRGFYDEAFEVVVTSSTPGASIYYTTDGSDPTLESPKADASDDQTPPSLTVSISDTTLLRAFAAKPDFIPTDIDTQSYFFLDQVISHPEMSPIITNNQVWGPKMRDALLEIPSISLITQEEIPDRTPSIQSPREIPISIEMIYPDGREGFQANAGVERFGGQYTLYDKKALRVSFKDIYGPKRLRFDLFDDVNYGAESAVDTFNQILLRNGSHDAIFYEGYPRPRNGAFVRGRYFLDRQLEMGNHSLRGKFVHVYLNGAYYGHYHLMERPTDDHMAEYFGGDEEDYDVMRGRSGISVQSGNDDAWNTLVGNARNWEVVQQHMDVNSYIDYMLLNFYGGNEHDWYPQHNWVAARKREEGAGFKFFMWDGDFMMRARLPDGGNTTDNGGPGGMINNLKTIPEFRLRMADRAYKHFYNDGVMTAERVNADYTALGNELANTIIPETARWGSYNASFYTPDTFQNAIQWLANDFPNGNQRPRVETVIQQMRASNLYPDIDAPHFSQHGGTVPAGFPLAINHDEGELYYTTDGSDPRLPDGSINPSATLVGGALFPNTLITKGATWKYDDSKTFPGADWFSSDFEDSSWDEGPSPIEAGGLSGVSTGTTAFAGTSKGLTFYARKTFEVTGASDFIASAVNVLYDDGFAIYLNGQEIVRKNLPDGPITIDTTASANGNESDYETFSFDPSFLVEGENLLAIEVHNRTLGNVDLGFDLELFGESRNPNRLVTIDETTIVKSRALQESEWSALNEATFITDVAADSSNLVISEIHYHPSVDQNNDAEFIELMNISDQRISLSGVHFSAGITFTFGGDATLAAGERVVLVFNQAAFESTYGTDIPMGGVYTARLANGGERLTLNAADGSVIETLNYGDNEPWPTVADGLGYSLVRVAPGGGGDAAGPENWRPSINPGGTPAASDSTAYVPGSGQSLLEYVTGSNTGGSITFLGETAIFEHRRIDGADDAHLEVQVSSDLENWSTSGVTFLNQVTMPEQSALMRWALPLPDGNRVFTRIHVTLNP